MVRGGNDVSIPQQRCLSPAINGNRGVKDEDEVEEKEEEEKEEEEEEEEYEGDVEGDPGAEDPETMGGRLRKICFRSRARDVFPVHESTKECRNPGEGRMSTRLPGARFSAHADPDSSFSSQVFQG
ncbi:hypothetical protein HZH68_012795 [Vespula germanica]|uniref:Uncharacterized protein n=1 Tax=Vespula germanica TaxID=30212 RepID=A0A834JEG7_VESGE|nr:hypothetical protein HZH68_012795 [Vespula germanica]